MISAIVLVPDPGRLESADDLGEVVVRSLAWLVSAVVAGLVREVVLAGPPGVGLGDIADRVGCEVFLAGSEAERLDGAVAVCRTARVLVLRAGYQPDAPVGDEINAFIRRAGPDAMALILAAPETMLERLLPGRAPVIGVLTPCGRVGTGGFDRLVRRSKPATRLRTRASRIT